MLQAKLDGTTLILAPCGRVDSTNAAALGEEINATLAQYDYETVEIDAEQLQYLSSAGLRMVLSLRKKLTDLHIYNVLPEVYEIFDMTGFTQIMTVEKALRRISVDGCPIIGKGAKGTVYRMNEDTIIKVYKDPNSLPGIKRERELAQRAFILGVPTAITYDIVRVGDSYGTVFELLNSKSLSQLILDEPEHRAQHIRSFAEFLRNIHEISADSDKIPDAKATVMKWYDAAKDFLPTAAASKLQRLISEVPDTGTLLHLDYHTNNVMQQDGALLLIDMDTLSKGHPIFDLANVYITYVGFGEIDPSVVESFLGLPGTLAKQIWSQFLAAYLGTDDPSKLQVVEQKAQLLSYTRFLRHTARRGGADTAEGRAIIALCAKKIPQLLEKIDSLDF